MISPSQKEQLLKAGQHFAERTCLAWLKYYKLKIQLDDSEWAKREKALNDLFGGFNHLIPILDETQDKDDIIRLLKDYVLTAEDHGFADHMNTNVFGDHPIYDNPEGFMDDDLYFDACGEAEIAEEQLFSDVAKILK